MLSATFSLTIPVLIIRSTNTIGPFIGITAKSKIFEKHDDSDILKDFTTKGCKIGGETIDNTYQQHHSLAVISEGCSGSSAVIKFVKRILEAHNIKYLPTHSEILKPNHLPCCDIALQTLFPNDTSSFPVNVNGTHCTDTDKNEFLSSDPKYDSVVVEAMNRVIHLATQTNRTLLFKANMGLLHDGILEGLHQLGTLFGIAYRGNYLDHAICKVRDCFHVNYGYPVFAKNGTKTELCFERRKLDPSIKVKAYIHDIPKFIKQIRRIEKENISHLKGFPFSGDVIQTTEDLFAYEFTSEEKDFSKSQDAWMKLLSFTTVDIRQDILTNMMREYQNSREMKSHRDVVQNIDEVARALNKAKPSLSHFLRL